MENTNPNNVVMYKTFVEIELSKLKTTHPGLSYIQCMKMAGLRYIEYRKNKQNN